MYIAKMLSCQGLYKDNPTKSTRIVFKRRERSREKTGSLRRSALQTLFKNRIATATRAEENIYFHQAFLKLKRKRVNEIELYKVSRLDVLVVA
jgi:hypothetical protein